jgi:beta-lactam-binding protein with PASTA domain
MTFSPINLLLGSVLAEREGVTDPQARIRLALFGSLFGGSPVTGITLTAVLARREVGESDRPALVVVPDVQELSPTEARQRLESLGLRVATRQVQSKAPVGSITNQNPDPSSVVLEGAVITLYISSGIEDSLVDLPDLVGRDFEDAREELQDRDFRLERVDVDSESRKNQVVDQDPKAGRVEPEILVKLFVSNGPAPDNPPIE